MVWDTDNNGELVKYNIGFDKSYYTFWEKKRGY